MQGWKATGSRCRLALGAVSGRHTAGTRRERWWVVAARVRQDKMDTFPELLSVRRCALVVAAIETGGRWSDETAGFVEEFVYARARDAQPLLRRAAALAW